MKHLISPKIEFIKNLLSQITDTCFFIVNCCGFKILVFTYSLKIKILSEQHFTIHEWMVNLVFSDFKYLSKKNFIDLDRGE